MTEKFSNLLHREVENWEWTEKLEEDYNKIYLILVNSFYYNTYDPGE